MSIAPLDPKKDPAKALSARFADLDAKFATRQAAVDACVERANTAVEEFKAAPTEKKTRMGVPAFSRAEIGDDTEEEERKKGKSSPG